MIHFHEFSSAEPLNAALAASAATLLREAISNRGNASLIVSGGKSPIGFFTALAKADLAWNCVAISLADERWVTAESADSNENLARKHLLVDRAAQAKFVGLMSAEATPAAAVAERTEAVLGIPRPFSLVVLGMGEDGHTASLFPGDRALAQAIDPQAAPALVAIAQPPAPAAPYARISMNLAAILNADRIALMISGEAKRKIYAQALHGASPMQYPIAAVLQQDRVPVDVYFST
jgi:6-phosphogluconolactonase